MNTSATSLRRRQKGFSLIEAAIVLGVIGLVIGGIWIAAAKVSENNRQQALNADLIKSLTEILNSPAAYWGANAGSGTNVFRDMNILPSSYVPSAIAGRYLDPYYGFDLQIIAAPTATPTAVRVRYRKGSAVQNISPPLCISVLGMLYKMGLDRGKNFVVTVYVTTSSPVASLYPPSHIHPVYDFDAFSSICGNNGSAGMNEVEAILYF